MDLASCCPLMRGWQARVWVIKKRFEGVPKLSDFEIKTETMASELKEGEFLAEALYFSVDPSMKATADKLKVGSVMPGLQVAKVHESKNKDFPVGVYIHGYFGWREWTINNGKTKDNQALTYVLPSFLNSENRRDDTESLNVNHLCVSHGLGMLGISGVAAYVGMLEVLKPKPNDVVVVSSAAGAVGHIAVQIAKKVVGCKVIGITSGKKKGSWCQHYLGMDYHINYMTQDVKSELSVVAPEGVDCYFDNVGGDISNAVIANMNQYGKVAMCGLTSEYCGGKRATINQWQILKEQLLVEGFCVSGLRWKHKWMKPIEDLHKWWAKGKLWTSESVLLGFSRCPEAFIKLFEQGNIAKTVVCR
ncbi:unnamed protein product [Acanthoscelides obtectus]|nr:unnamed protein product [Acanthoscelides obtectus]CAH1982348.1 unnamed protein product [Acanthoscelides obtectus]CAK1638239.1 Prostaglandin reductase 1 [Acanthoscelides obtectus]CAK1672404.1 Prostaglandin reductase 1 [Acanthoscelides obtectus]